MQYIAKIVDLQPADPGFSYPIYEYRTASGTIERVTAHNAMVINPWDLTKEHKIQVNEHGELVTNQWLGIVLAVGFIAAFIAAGFLLPEAPFAFGLIFIVVGLIPAFIFGKNAKNRIRRRKAIRSLSPTTGKIIWYQEVVRRTKNSTSVYHYPIVEYHYKGHVMYAKLPDNEPPVHEGEHREFYLDCQHEDIFTVQSIKSGNAFAVLFTLFFTLPFTFMGVGMMLPEESMESLLDWATDALIKITAAGEAAEIGNYTPFVMVGIFLLTLAIPTIKELKKLISILYAKRNGQIANASLIKTNDFGRRSVKVYQYTYMGQPKQYQSTIATGEHIDIYIHPTTKEAYSQKDILAQGVKLGVLLFMIIMSLCMTLPLFL